MKTNNKDYYTDWLEDHKSILENSFCVEYEELFGEFCKAEFKLWLDGDEI